MISNNQPIKLRIIITKYHANGKVEIIDDTKFDNKDIKIKIGD